MEKPVSTLGKKLSPYLRIAAVIIVLMLLLFAAIRFQTWKGEKDRQVLVLVNPWNPVSVEQSPPTNLANPPLLVLICGRFPVVVSISS